MTLSSLFFQSLQLTSGSETPLVVIEYIAVEIVRETAVVSNNTDDDIDMALVR